MQPGPAHLGPAPHHDLIDPQLTEQLAPAALQAGSTALTMLPLLAATALAGLGKNTSNGNSTPTTGHTTNPLGNLADTYGNGNPTTPTTGNLTTPTTNTNSNGNGNGNTALRYRQLYQHTVATAFNNLDNQLLHFITDLAAGHTLDKKAVVQLLRDVDVQLAQLGPTAYTTTGQQQVHQILTTAVIKAEHLVTGSHTTATQTATEINQLTNQYLYNLAGKNYTFSTIARNTVGGTVGQWIQQAMGVLQQMGYDTSKIDPQAIAIIIHYESGGNPNSVNNSDSNAAAGHPSEGLMQTIGPTFATWSAPGHKNILDPVDNIVAGVRYAINRYGSVGNVPGVVAVRNGRSYVGY